MATYNEIGMNRTGIASSPKHSANMVAGTEEFHVSSPGDELVLARVRAERAKAAEPLGHVPPPLSVKGMAKTAVQAAVGGEPTLLIDKLGERLGFERAGVRLYQALLTKFDALGSFTGGPARDDIEDILKDEQNHFALLEGAIKKMGGDPTALTPSADLHATLTRGALDVMVDARTTLAQCLEAALLLELADNDCWQALLELSQQGPSADLSQAFADALREEEKHLARVRGWIAAAQGRTS
jgi:rubrerythrin